MDTPEGKLGLQRMLQEALVQHFPEVESEVSFAGVTGHDVMWRITLGGTVRELTQRETTVLLHGHATEFKQYFRNS